MMCMAGDCADRMLAGLVVLSVEPAPSANHLMVTVGFDPTGATGTEEAAARAALQRASGRLRTSVAAALNRKRAPELRFHLLPMEGWTHE